MTDVTRDALLNVLEDLLTEVKKEQRILIETDEAAKLISISPSYLKALRQTAKGPKFVKCGVKVLYDPDELKEWASKLPRH